MVATVKLKKKTIKNQNYQSKKQTKNTEKEIAQFIKNLTKYFNIPGKRNTLLCNSYNKHGIIIETVFKLVWAVEHFVVQRRRTSGSRNSRNWK